MKPADIKINQPSGATPTADAEDRALQQAALAHLQKTYALIKIGGKVWAHDQQGSAAPGHLGTAQKLVFYNRSDATLLMARTLRKEYPAANASKVLKAFFVHPGSVCFSGLEFNPAGTTPGYLNLWLGSTITPKAGSWPLIQAFLLEVICAGDERNYRYLLHFIAHALQRPEEKPGILVILLGGQGIGKGTLGKILRSIWGATYLHVHDISTVVGTFNASLERAYVVFMDEALFAGDRKGSDALKSLTTEPVISVNEKHQPARQVSSFHRFFAASNAEHLKHVDRDDRRDFVLRVSELRKGDHAYWQALNAEMDNGGIAALAHDLLAMDLSAFNVRSKPNTGELVEQKLHSLSPIARWWFDALDSGDITPEGEWSDFIMTIAIINGVVELAGNKLYKKPSAIDVLREMAQLCPSASKHQQGSRLGRNRGLKIPSLEQARAEFEQYIGGKVDWSRYGEED